MALFEKFFNSTKDLCCICDLQGNFLEVSDAWLSRLGWAKEELVGRHIFNFVPVGDRGPALEDILIEKDKPYFVTYRFKNKSNDYRWLSWSFTESSADGVLYAIARDITDVRKYNLSLEALVSSLDDMIFLIDETGLFIELWTGRPDLLQIPKEEILGKKIRDVFGDLGFSLESCLTQALNNNQTMSMEFQLPNNPTWFTAKVTPVNNLPTKKRMASFLIRDVSEMRAADEALNREHANFLAASKLANLGEMAAGIAHEINNPLAIIQGKAWILKRSVTENKFDSKIFEEALDKILETTNRISKIVSGLKAFSRDGESDPIEEVNIATVVDNALQLCRERFKNHGIEFRSVNRKDINVECRGIQISQVILNLLSNSFDAVKKMKDAWVELRVSDENTHVEISVTDSGPGISQVLQQKIMQPFFTTKETGTATGLGLSITKGIIEAHKGELKYDNHSVNTKFIIRLPKKQNREPKKLPA
jgi:PAS domain S-box-containing protein